MFCIKEALEASRAALLDSTLRNPLINHKLLRAKGVAVVDESAPDVYQILVKDSKAMSFQPKLETAVDERLPSEDAETESDQDVVDTKDSKLQTDHPSEELKKRLLNTFYAARTAIEEQGVSTLYLALGMLDWYESESSDILHRAPLILVPVELSRTSVRASFRLAYTKQEIGTNLSLREKLKDEFGIELPELLGEDQETDDLDADGITAYYEKVSDAVADFERWRVDETAIVLSFFSFTKFLMYRDLDPEGEGSDTLTQNPILQAVLGEGFKGAGSPISDAVPNIDEVPDLAEMPHVVDADSSQALAIHDVSEGRNLVIQGPPGTGKSQTITNIIGTAIAEGKRVLFVAEKMAALEVVKRNLDKVGLGNACLELHSYKMNKKAVIDELRDTLGAGEPKPVDINGESEGLVSNRRKLNEYCEAVNKPIGDNNVTPYQAFGEALAAKRRLSGVDIPALDFKNFQHSEAEFRVGLEKTTNLQVHLKAMGSPSEHPFWGSRRTRFLPADRGALETGSVKAREATLHLKDSSEALAQHLTFRTPESRGDVEEMIRAARQVLAAPDLAGIRVQSPEWSEQREDLESGLDAGKRLSRIRSQYRKTLIPDAWNQDVLTIRQALAAHGDKWWRIFLKDYRHARNELKGLCAQPLPTSNDEQLGIVDAILEYRRGKPIFEKVEALGRKLFGGQWHGESSDWTHLEAVFACLSGLYESVETGEIPDTFVAYLAGSPDLNSLETLVKNLEQRLEIHRERLEALIATVDLDETARFGASGALEARPFTEQIDILEGWEKGSEKLRDIAVYNELAADLKASGFREIVAVADAWPGADTYLADLLRYTWYDGQADRAMRERPILGNFAGHLHANEVENFCRSDQRSLETNKTRVVRQHWENLPQSEGAVGQLGILKREFEKRARHLPIRKLMEKAGEAVQRIKPIFMMSPLSVALFLPRGTIDFDLVIFDEASQVKPVDAFSAIARGKQAIVVGDDRQLPPTDFFTKLAQEDEDAEDDGDFVRDAESILGLFKVKGAPERMLRWHYRSRHESLITVSNFEFYQNKLQLFPSPDTSGSEIGLVYHHLSDTDYDFGKSRTNRKEAEAVAGRVMDHAREFPDLTLGVATFSQAQMQAIQDQLELLRRKDTSCESFFTGHAEEPFFVKNLENVQGDERDVIFISVGYGRDVHGKLAMNFGPLNKDGGERRLNVLITRARQRCEVFTNLTADDIDLGRTQAQGVKSLKQFLHYAKTRTLDIPIPTGKEPDSPFEREVAAALRERGYAVEYQIGSAGYFIDLGIKDPDAPGRYLLGIECDGATYHSAQSARDRDRLRQSVLERLGWRIHRIWSTDWFSEPARELDKAVAAIEQAKREGAASPDAAAPGDVPTPSEEKTEPESEPAENRSLSPAAPKKGVVAESYQVATLTIPADIPDLHNVPIEEMAEWVEQVVRRESPVHIEEVGRRIITAAGVKRLGGRIRDAVEVAVNYAAYSEQVEVCGDFLYWTAQASVPIRNRARLERRSQNVAFIAPEELAAAIQAVVSTAIGIELEGLIRETCKLFGFSTVTEERRDRVKARVDELLQEGVLAEKGAAIVLSS